MARITPAQALQIADEYELSGEVRRGFLAIAGLFAPVGPYDAYAVATRVAERARRGDFERGQQLLTLGGAFLHVDFVRQDLLDFVTTPGLTVNELVNRIQRRSAAP